MYDGHLERIEEQKTLMAWQISWLTAPHVKKPLKMKDILGTKKSEMQFNNEFEKMMFLKNWFKGGEEKKNGIA